MLTSSTISQTGSAVVVVAAPPTIPRPPNCAPRMHHAGDDRRRRGERHHHDVAVRDVRQLVGEHALELVERRAGRRMPVVTQTAEWLGRAAGRERVRQVGVGDRHRRLRHVGQRAEPVDHRVQLGRLVRASPPGPASP